ncbi:MAG: hypothetical protein M1826_000427 [Phylliscum demangeonii]|nr:MAG: hypothetical protein M1826_000427 [Phylliscum demangeonii]
MATAASAASSCRPDNGHAAPPAQLKEVYKRYQSATSGMLEDDEQMVDWASNECPRGLRIYPALIPPRSQLRLLSCLLHRDLSNGAHQTNVHLHHHLSPPQGYAPPPTTTTGGELLKPSSPVASNSFFRYDPASTVTFAARDPQRHAALPIARCLRQRLRWITLGGQYDWTTKRYPVDRSPPRFPADVGRLVQGLFPHTTAEAAIVNLYSPGDTLRLHRDVSEQSAKDLVSLSLGCDAVFVIGDGDGGQDVDGDVQVEVVRLHSGDVVVMSGPARYGWHGVPKIVPDTCPAWMADWPASPRSGARLTPTEGEEEEEEGGLDEFEGWRGWMAGKRVNLNVRQMFDGS